MPRLTRRELQIIEETKREGAKLQEQEEATGITKKHVRLWSMLAFIFIFILLAIGIKLLFGLVS